MKTLATYPDQFRKPSGKTLDEIKRACEILESEGNHDYIVKHNGRHIWIEMGPKKQEAWSPLLHLEVDEKSDATYLNGKYVENPILWATFLALRIVAFTLFALSLVSATYKFVIGQQLGTELLVMFGMASVWFGIYLLGKLNRKLSLGQAAELRDFMDNRLA